MAAKPPRGFSPPEQTFRPLRNWPASSRLASPACLSVYLSIPPSTTFEVQAASVAVPDIRSSWPPPRAKKHLVPTLENLEPQTLAQKTRTRVARQQTLDKRLLHRSPPLSPRFRPGKPAHPSQPFSPKIRRSYRRTIAASLATEIRTASHEDLLFRRCPRAARSAI